jgi:membrane-associated protein
MSFNVLELSSLKEFIKTSPEIVRYSLIWGIVFAESGIMLGFFLPGDTLLIVAGLLAKAELMDIRVLIFGCFVAAVLGDNVGYATGHRFGRKLFNKEDSLLFHKKHLIKAQNFYDKHGKMTIVLARFLPIVRTFAPIVAGIASMRYKTFMSYNLIGGFLWTFGVTLLGYFIAGIVSEEVLDKYLIVAILVVVVLSLLPSIIHLIKESKSNDPEV